MRRTALYLLIFTFLSVLFSNSLAAQEKDEAALFYEAALCERRVFEAENPKEAVSALSAKAEAYEKAGEYSKALACLNRIPVYLLSPQQRVKLA